MSFIWLVSIIGHVVILPKWTSKILDNTEYCDDWFLIIHDPTIHVNFGVLLDKIYLPVYRSAELENPKDRMVELVRWFLSSLSSSRKVHNYIHSDMYGKVIWILFHEL